MVLGAGVGDKAPKREKKGGCEWENLDPKAIKQTKQIKPYVWEHC